MDLIQANISEIKNLNLIYIYTTDSSISNNSSKYIGATITYNQNQTLKMDYKDSHFEEFLKKVIEVYNEEKNTRKIILLGNLSNKIVNDEYFRIDELDFSNQESVTPFSSNNMYIYKFRGLIFELIKSILLFYKQYEVLEIDDIQGYNNKWAINYKVGSVVKKLPVLIYKDIDGNINIRISNIEGTLVDVTGKIGLDKDKMVSSWQDNKSNVLGDIRYDIDKNTISYIYNEDDKLIKKEEFHQSLNKTDEKILSYYKNLFGINGDNFIKINPNTYMSYHYDSSNGNNDENLYSLTRELLNINKQKAFYEKREYKGIGKYNNEIMVKLDESISSASLIKIDDEVKPFVLIERTDTVKGIDNTYYEIIDNPNKNNLDCLEELSRQKIEEVIQTVYDVKKLVRKGAR